MHHCRGWWISSQVASSVAGWRASAHGYARLLYGHEGDRRALEELGLARVSGTVEPAMNPVDWSRVGISKVESEGLLHLAVDDDEFSLGYLVELWQQWVVELEAGQLWVRDERMAALDCRDDLDAVLPLVPTPLRGRVFRLVDELDRRFAINTVPMTPTETNLSPNWWRIRVPINNSQRLYLFDRIGDGQGQ